MVVRFCELIFSRVTVPPSRFPLVSLTFWLHLLRRLRFRIFSFQLFYEHLAFLKFFKLRFKVSLQLFLDLLFIFFCYFPRPLLDASNFLGHYFIYFRCDVDFLLLFAFRSSISCQVSDNVEVMANWIDLQVLIQLPFAECFFLFLLFIENVLIEFIHFLFVELQSILLGLLYCCLSNSCCFIDRFLSNCFSFIDCCLSNSFSFIE